MTWADFVWRLIIPILLLFLGLYGLTTEEKKGAVHPKFKLGVIDIPILQLPKPWHWVAKIIGLGFIILSIFIFVKREKTEAPLGVNLISISYVSSRWDPKMIDLRKAQDLGISILKGDSLRLFDVWVSVPEDAAGYEIQAKVYLNDDRDAIGETPKQHLIPGAMKLDDIVPVRFPHPAAEGAWSTEEYWQFITIELQYFKENISQGYTKSRITFTSSDNAWLIDPPKVSFAAILYSINDGYDQVLDLRQSEDQGLNVREGDTIKIKEVWYSSSSNGEGHAIYLDASIYDNDSNQQINNATSELNPVASGIHQLKDFTPIEWIVPKDFDKVILVLLRDDYVIMDRLDIPLGSNTNTGLVNSADVVMWPFDLVAYLDFENQDDLQNWSTYTNSSYSLSTDQAFSGSYSMAVTITGDPVENSRRVAYEHNVETDLVIGWIYWPEQEGINISWAEVCTWVCESIPTVTNQWNRFILHFDDLMIDGEPLEPKKLFWIQGTIDNVSEENPYTFFCGWRTNLSREKRVERIKMTTESATIVQRLWNYCNVLRDDGVSYGDYVEQLTYLLFLKMAHEQTQPPFRKPSIIPEPYAWPSLTTRDGGDLEVHYRETLIELGKSHGMLGVIFRKAQNRIQDPAKLKRLVALIDEETWMGLDIDIKGEIYEGLLQKNAEDTKSGAGQYFTPRPLIKAMVAVMQPRPGMTLCDPACGTGGFFLAAHDYLTTHYQLDRDQKHALRHGTFKGWEIVDNTARLCVMNLYLHGIGADDSPVEVNDSLISDPGQRFDMVLTNPPFGKKSSITIVNEEGKADRAALTYERDDFWATTSNKQLNFVQHITTLLKINGTAAVVVPDNVLFEGGAGETVRRRLLHGFDVHTLLRLPTGIFYAQGVKANVLFFDKKPGREQPWTEKVWIYDLRTNQHFTLKTNPMREEDLQDFITCYHPENRRDRQESERFKAFTYDEILARDKLSLDIFWLKDESLEDTENLPDPDVLAQEIVENLESALMQFESILEGLGET